VLSLKLRLHFLVDFLNIVFAQLDCQQLLSCHYGVCNIHLFELETSAEIHGTWVCIDVLGHPTTSPAESPASADLGIMWK
jgi:hypothetical protein